MLPSDLHDFLLASVGASASFIGLLFVALTVVITRSDRTGKIEHTDRILAQGSYTALISILFVCMVGLLPKTNISSVLLAMGISGVLVSLGTNQNRQQSGISYRSLLRFLPLATYAFMAIYGLLMIIGTVQLQLSLFYIIIFVLYGIALSRAWALTGVSE